MERWTTLFIIPLGILLGLLICVLPGVSGGPLEVLSVPALQRADAPEPTDEVSADGDRAAAGRFFEPAAPRHRLETFFRSLEASGRRTSILQLGDSHTAADTLSGQLRRRLQLRFGSAGRGFALPGEPWPGFRQEQMRFGMSRGWTSRLGTKSKTGGPFGIGGVQLETRSPGASVTRRTCEDCRFGRSFDTYALHFLRQPGGGDLAVEVDDQIHRRVSTDGPTGLGVLEGRVPPGDHELRVVSEGGGPVALLGLRTLSGDRGVEYSSLGLNGATAPDFAEMHGAVTAAELGRLDPDLLVFAFGTNGAYNLYRFARKYADNPKAIAQQEHRWARGYRRLLSRTLSATDGASCLVVTPPDLEAGGCRWRSSTPGRCTRRPAVFDRVVAHQTRIARQFGCAVWRQSEAMGGPGSIRRWHNRQPTLAQKDGKHLTIEGYRAVGDQLYDDLMGAYESWQRGEPTPLTTRTIR